MHRRDARDPSGYVLAELLLSAVLIGILASIVLPNVTAMDRASKVTRFSGVLEDLQRASDGFHATTGSYPTYVGAMARNQPVASSSAAQINPAARDNQSLAFWPAYLRVMPDNVPSRFAIGTGPGATLFLGVTSTGKTFATLVPPQGGMWTDGAIPIYIEESTRNTDTTGHPESIALSSVW